MNAFIVINVVIIYVVVYSNKCSHYICSCAILLDHVTILTS